MFLPDVVAQNSEATPDAPFYVFAQPDPFTDIVTITHFEFGRATHRAAQILRPNCEGSDGEVVAILALADTVVYHALVVGLITANLIPFPVCPRLSAAATVQLLRKSSCHRLLATCRTLEPLIREIQKEIAQTDPGFLPGIEEIPSVSRIYPNLGSETPSCAFTPHGSGPNTRSLDHICLYLHSSGTTIGFPKPIAHTHRTLMQWSRFAMVREIRDYISSPYCVGTMGIPSFGLSGTFCQLLNPLHGGIAVAVYPPTATSPELLPILPSPENVLNYARKTNCKAVMTFPDQLSIWVTSADAISYLKTLNLVLFGGGTLPQLLGDTLVNSGVNLRTLYAGTEFGAISTLVPLKRDEGDWNWVRLTDEVKSRWVPKGDGLFECQILTWQGHKLSVETLEDAAGYATSDLFVNHPEKKHLWKLIGRLDDFIVHRSGKKTMPTPMEDMIISSSSIAGAIMFGESREVTGILIQSMPHLQVDVSDKWQVMKLRDKVWPLVESANETAPEFSRISKDMVIFTSSEKPLPRSAVKRTISRKEALQLYAGEISAL
ncbi:hypothetical protein DFH09DRAFT_1419188, partial [Mycena vulgaris]